MTSSDQTSPSTTTDAEARQLAVAKRRRRRKIMASISGVVVFVIGFVANEGLGELKDRLMPDQAEAQAQRIRESIDKKTDTIAKISAQMQSRLEAMGGDPQLAKDTQELLAAINALNPDLRDAAEMGSTTVNRLISAKNTDLDRRGFSTTPDFLLPSGGGATVCPERYSFGFYDVDPSTPQVTVRLSGDQQDTNDRNRNPGGSVYLDTPDGGLVEVGYVGVSDAQNGIYGFNVICR